MFINVKLLNGLNKILTYKIPETWDQKDIEGSIVKVPLRNRIELAYVYKTINNLEFNPNYNIKNIISLEEFPQDKNYISFIDQISKYYSIDSLYFYKKLKLFLKQDQKNNKTVINNIANIKAFKNVELTNEQEQIVNSISQHISISKYFPSLIYGVTGSGKTEVYKALINKAYLKKQTSLLILPEVTLAIQFYNKLKQELQQDIKIFSFHSATSIKEKRLLWKSLINKEPILIIGVHLPILLPIFNLGLIIIDEEHETGYQEKKNPKINTKEAALIRAKINNIPIVLGSATPSISSMYNTTHKNWNLFELKKRFAGQFPKVKIVNLIDKSESANKQKNKNFWISKDLELAIKDRLNKKEQIIIYLNRRGYSFFIQCKNCSYIPTCSSCSVSLTLHQSNFNSILKCHYCDYSQTSPNICPDCKGPEKDFLKKGLGTQQAVNILQTLFAQANIARADLDNTINKKKWQQTLEDFSSGKINILVGTQTITKGYHFPKVTLVGVLWADLNLSLPIYNAAETTLQQLIQVSGRAGRQSPDSLVIIQTMLDHYIFNYINEIKYSEFLKKEDNYRQDLSYPPYIRLADIEIKNKNLNIIDKEASKIVQELQNYIDMGQLKVNILGPSTPPVDKIKSIYTRKIYLKSKDINQLVSAFNFINKKNFTSKINFTPNPLSI